MKQWKDDELLLELHKFYKECGRVPRTRELKGEYPNASTYRKRFGSVRNALLEAGLPVDNVVRRPYAYTDVELLDFIYEAAEKLGRIPVYTDFQKKKPFENFPHVKTFNNRFGSFQNAIEQSGVKGKDFSPSIEKTIKRGETIMENRLQPGSYKNVTNGIIACNVQGNPTVIKKGVVVNLSREDLAEIVDSDIIRKGLLLPTKDNISVDDSFIKNFYTEEMMEEKIRGAENADELEELFQDIDSIMTMSRFLNVLNLLDSPTSYISVCQAHIDDLKMEEIPA